MMKIKWIEFENLDTGLKINRTCFFKNSTLLVGKSGAGKTQILESIKTLCNIAVHKNLEHFNVDGTICFSFNDCEYIWHIRTETTMSQLSPNNSILLDLPFPLLGYVNTTEKQTIITHEFLAFKSAVKDQSYSGFEKNKNFKEYYNIFDRNDRKISVYGYSKTPKVNKYVSLINLYNENDLIKDVYKCFNQVYEINTSASQYMPISYLDKLKIIETELKKCNTIDKYREIFPSYHPLSAKLYLLKNTNKELFDDLISSFQGIFPEIEGTDVVIDSDNDQLMSICFSINGRLISSEYISMGMTKAFVFLFDLLTISNNYVVIIDEIENGLGINCIDDVYSLITSMREDLQFIITSHHPYIINKVNPKTCKLVDRKNNIVSTYSAEKLGITNSHHDFFDLLMNKMEHGIK